MQQRGYESKGEYGIPFRRYFQKGITPYRTHNVHVFEEGNPEIDRHLKFRDWMRIHASDREAYGKLKAELAATYPDDVIRYCLGKEAFIVNIDVQTGFNGLRIVQALTDREWEAVRNFRQKYFFDAIHVSDPYTWTFSDKKHVHFVLYQGIKIIGYAHIQLWPENRSALRIIVIDEPYRHLGLGSQFLKLCERWLSHQGIKTLHIQSSPAAYSFYCRYHYIYMPFNDPDGYKGDPQDIDIGKTLKVTGNEDYE
jgi:GNAT superfamily N-acetyltransferase